MTNQLQNFWGFPGIWISLMFYAYDSVSAEKEGINNTNKTKFKES